MNKLPKNVSKVVMGFATSCVLATPCMACGPSLGSAGIALLFGAIALVALVPLSIASAGMVAAVRARRDGLSWGKGFVGLCAVAVEAGIARFLGPESLVGALSVGLGGLQVALFALALANGRGVSPLPGRVTILSAQALGLNL